MAKFGLCTDLTLTNPLAKAALDQQLAKITKITDTIREALRKQIKVGFDKGESVDEIADRLKKQFQATRARCRTIARTEINQANNTGHQLQAQQNFGTNYDKVWVTARDMRVRKTHQALNGIRLKATQPFNNGLQHPHDPQGSAVEVINCRCTLMYFPHKPMEEAGASNEFGNAWEASRLPVDSKFLQEVEKHRAAAQKYVRGLGIPEAVPGWEGSRTDYKSVLYEFLASQKFSHESIEKVRNSLFGYTGGWVVASDSRGGQLLNGTATKLVGGDLKKQFVSPNKAVWTDELSGEAMRALAAQKTLAEEYFERFYAKGQRQGYMFRGVADRNFMASGPAHSIVGAIDGGADAVDVGMNTLSSWSAREDIAADFAGIGSMTRYGTVLRRVVDKSQVWGVIPGHEMEVLVGSPTTTRFRREDVIQLGRQKGLLKPVAISIPLVQLDKDPRNLNWMQNYRKMKKEGGTK